MNKFLIPIHSTTLPVSVFSIISSFQDRGKRFRLQQFICKHANKLFTHLPKPREDPPRPGPVNAQHCPILPPFEWFVTVDKEMRLQRFFEVNVYHSIVSFDYPLPRIWTEIPYYLNAGSY